MSKKILIVEGDPSVLAEVKDELEGKGFLVDQTSDSKTVVETIRKQAPDLVILAVDLAAGQSGYLVCGKIKKDDELKKIPVVILGNPDSFAQHKKLKTRADEYVGKPVDLSELSQKIGELIGFPEASSVEIVDESLTLSDLVDEEEPGAAHIVEDEIVEESADAAPSTHADPDLEMLDAAFEQMSLTGREESLPVEESVEEPVEAPPETISEQDEHPEEELNGHALSVEADAALDGLADDDPLSVSSEVPIDIDESALADLGEHSPEPGFELSEPSANGDSDTSELRSELAKKEKENLRLKSDLNRRDHEILDLREREMKLEQEVAHGSGEIARRDAQIKTISARVDQLTNERKKFDQQLAAAREESKSAASRVSTLQRDVSQLRSEQAEAKKALDEAERLQRELEQLRSDAQSARREAEDAHGELESVKSQLTNQSEEAASLRQRIAELEEATQKHEDRVSKFYQKLKDDEKIREKTKKALSIALHLLEEQQRAELENNDDAEPN